MNKHIQKERTYMKHLKIENQKAFFTRGESWLVVTDMTKEDLLNLAHSAIEEDDFETDKYDEALLPNPAHKIIYQQINTQLTELHNRRGAFQEEVRNIYKDAYNKYCIDYSLFGFTYKNEWIIVLFITIILTISTEIGDLVASKFKRHYDIKDYGNLFPGHGGVMDRFDSVIFTCAVFFIVLTLLGVVL